MLIWDPHLKCVCVSVWVRVCEEVQVNSSISLELDGEGGF